MIDFLLDPKKLPLAACAVLLAVAMYLSAQLDTERAGHDATREKLTAAVREGNRWKVAADVAWANVATLQDNVKECLAREAQAKADAADRAAIMRAAQPRERTPAEAKGVVDDATRKKAMDRLNRPL